VDFSMAGYVYYPPDETGFDIAQIYPAATMPGASASQRWPGWKPPYELMPSDRLRPSA